MTRRHGLAVAALLAAGSVAGTYAVITTSHLAGGETKPEVVASAALAKRAKQLDRWNASLVTALRSRPPALPAVPRYAPVTFVAAGSSSPLPALPVASAGQVGPARPVAVRTAKVDAAGKGGVRRVPEAPESPETPAAPAAAQPTLDREGSAAPADAKRAAEQQCEALKQTAKSQGEQAKKTAEQECEALEKAAEGDD